MRYRVQLGLGCAAISAAAALSSGLFYMRGGPTAGTSTLIASVALTAGLLSAAFSFWMTTPFDKIMTGIREIQRDNFRFRFALPGDSEFSQIAQTLNTMADVLYRSQELELKSHKASKFAEIGLIASSVGHELKEPLNVALNSLFYLKDGLKESSVLKEDPTMREMLELAEKELRGMATLISDLLSFSRVIKLDLQPADVSTILVEAKGRVEIPKTIKMEEKYAPLPKVSVDPAKMTQVFINLIRNAIQAMPKGGTLSISARKEESGKNSHAWAVVEFKDTGVGIPPDQIGKIYEPVFTTKAKGAGMGLVLSNRVVSAHDGLIEVQSTVGKGTTFKVRIPLLEISGSGEDAESASN